MSDQLKLPEEVCEHFRITRKQLRRLVNAGKLPAVRIGKQLRFDIDVIEAFLQSDGRPHDSRVTE
jgi:excisionase family DNA binding protein